jgi:hypothetical protein
MGMLRHERAAPDEIRYCGNMHPQLVVRPDAVVEQILIQCWLYEARGGDLENARRRAERTLERLLAKGLPYQNGANGMRLDPYAANNFIKAPAGELDDEAWAAWQHTTRRNAVSLPAGASLFRFTLRREWHAFAVTPGRPVILRLPLPLRQSQHGPANVRLLEPVGAAVEIREMPGCVELRVDSVQDKGPIVAELEVSFTGGEIRDSMAPADTLGTPVLPEEEIWLRDREALIILSAPVTALATTLAQRCSDTREFMYACWHWLMTQLRFGDVHRSDLVPDDPLGGLLQSRRADCVLGSSLLVALCRARGIPARLVAGYLLHPANLGPHSWAEIRLAPHLWVPVDYGSWCYCAGDATDPAWGTFYRGRIDARFLAEVAPREFTGWGSAPPPARWYRLERLHGDRIEHTLYTLPDNALFRRDLLDLQILKAGDSALP